MKLSKNLLAVALFSALSFGVGGSALAQSGRGQSGITLAEAERIALAEVPNGTVKDIERERELRGDVFEVSVLDERGVEHEIVIDADNGNIISSRIDND